MEVVKIIEDTKEYCVICRKWKKGPFTLAHISDKYIPICRSCLKKPITDKWSRHIMKKGYRSVVKEE